MEQTKSRLLKTLQVVLEKAYAPMPRSGSLRPDGPDTGETPEVSEGKPDAATRWR